MLDFLRVLHPARIETALRQIAIDGAHLLRHAHELKEIAVKTKDELKAEISEVRDILVEAKKDVNRLADKLDAAVEAGDFTDVSAAVQERRELGQGIGDRAEQSDPEAPVEPAPVEPTPAPAPDQPNQQV